MYFGPTRPEEAIPRVEDMLARVRGHRLAEANAMRTIGRFLVLKGRNEEGRAMVARSLAVAEELGLTTLMSSILGFAMAPSDMLAGDLEAAERNVRASIEISRRNRELGAS